MMIIWENKNGHREGARRDDPRLIEEMSRERVCRVKRKPGGHKQYKKC